jgi:hypothetical protein
MRRGWLRVISYSRVDHEYVQRLAAYLRSAGLPVWVDSELDYGNRWPQTIRDRIDECSVLLAVMSPDAENAVWVDREIARAEERSKPIAPVLLSGQPMFLVGGYPIVDVRPDRMPEAEFVEWLRQHVAAAGTLFVTQTNGRAAAFRRRPRPRWRRPGLGEAMTGFLDSRPPSS